MKRPVVTLDDVDAAARRIDPTGHMTPFVRSAWLCELTGAEVWLKLEIEQPTQSFKIRGALNAIRHLKEVAPETSAIVTASAGNHGQAVAYASHRLKIRARVYVPAKAPATKRSAITGFGAEVIETTSYEAAEAEAHEYTARTGIRYLSPYADPDVIAGAGTVAREMLRELPMLDTLVVPLGGGGLLAGTAIVAHAVARARIVGVEAAASPAFTAALAAGRPVIVDVRETLADGLAGNMEPDNMTFPLVRDLVTEVAMADEDGIAGAMRDLYHRQNLIVEGAAACAVAWVVRQGRSLAGRAVGVIISGGNVDLPVLERAVGGPVPARRPR